MIGFKKEKKLITSEGLANALLTSDFFSAEAKVYDKLLLLTYEELKWHSGYLSNETGDVTDKPGSDLYLQLDPKADVSKKISRMIYFCHALSVAEFLSITDYVIIKLKGHTEEQTIFTKKFGTDHFLKWYIYRSFMTPFFINNRKKRLWEGNDYVPYLIKIACNDDLSKEGIKIIRDHIKKSLDVVKNLLDKFEILTSDTR